MTATALVREEEEEPKDENDALVLSIDECIDKLGVGPFQRRVYWAAGLCFGADAMEILLLSFLAPLLRDQWGLRPSQTALLTSSIFGGSLVGTLVLGVLGDAIGRRPTFLLASLLIATFGILSSTANNFGTILFMRTIVGVGIGGLTIPYDTMAEFLPQSARGTQLLSLNYFWTLGTLLVVLASYLSQQNWRLFLIVCAVPCIISTLVSAWWVPESPRWLLSQGRHDQALAVLRQAAQLNQQQQPQQQQHDTTNNQLFPPGTILRQPNPDASTHKSCLLLLQPGWFRVILVLSVVWAGFGLLYYSTVLIITLVFAHDKDETTRNSGVDIDYVAITMSVLSEFVGVTMVLLTIDRWGRVVSQVYSYLLGGICLGVLCWLSNPAVVSDDEDGGNSNNGRRGWLVALAFGARLFWMSGSCVTWTITAELLTTEVRTTGHSLVNAIARVTGGLSPFVVQGFGWPFSVVGVVLLVASLVTTAASWTLPETKGIAMGTAILYHPTTNTTNHNNSATDPHEQQQTRHDLELTNQGNNHADFEII